MTFASTFCAQQRKLDIYSWSGPETKQFRFRIIHREITKINGQNNALHTSLMYYLENLTTMPTEEAQIDTFLAGRPKNKAVKAKKAAPPRSKKRKNAPKVDDGSTGIFDDTDDEDTGDLEEESAVVPEVKPGQHDLLNLHKHKRVFSDAWIAFLQLQLPEDDVKRVLVMLHRQVMPHLVEPSVLIDFLADSCDYGELSEHCIHECSSLNFLRTGGTLALLALNGLFTLITKHRLYVDVYLESHTYLMSALSVTILISIATYTACWTTLFYMCGIDLDSCGCWTSFCLPGASALPYFPYEI
jgi:hypothetical protein